MNMTAALTACGAVLAFHAANLGLQAWITRHSRAGTEQEVPEPADDPGTRGGADP